MRVDSVRIENFRVFSDVTVSLNPYVCFVGPNGAGKSTVINALNVFFREQTSSNGTDVLTQEDFHNRNTDRPVRITVTFADLSLEAQEDFKHYFRQDKLVITAEAAWDEDSQQAPVRQYGQRSGMDVFRPFFETLADRSTKVAQLKEVYERIRKDHLCFLSPAPKTRWWKP